MYDERRSKRHKTETIINSEYRLTWVKRQSCIFQKRKLSHTNQIWLNVEIHSDIIVIFMAATFSSNQKLEKPENAFELMIKCEVFFSNFYSEGWINWAWSCTIACCQSMLWILSRRRKILLFIQSNHEECKRVWVKDEEEVSKLSPKLQNRQHCQYFFCESDERLKTTWNSFIRRESSQNTINSHE